MKKTWNRIETWLEGHAPLILGSLAGGASDQELEECERGLGISLPESVRESYRIHNGQHESEITTSSFIYEYRLFSLRRIAQEWSIWADLANRGEFNGVSSEAPGRVRDDLWWRPEWIPLTGNSA